MMPIILSSMLAFPLASAEPAHVLGCSHRLANLVRERELQDLVENLDAALDTLESYATCEDDTRIKQHDRFYIEYALEAAATFLHELRLQEIALNR